MNRVLAGIYDPRSLRDWARTRAALEDAIEGEEVSVAQEGPLKVGWTGSGGMPGAPVGPLCLLDGHIYNLEALAREAGVPSSRGSEQVLATAYTRLGEGMLERLRGDFVLLVWDPERGSGLLARDQLGGRSLCFHAAGDRLLFASEVRYLLRLLPSRPSPDRAALVHWLAVSGPPGDSTLYQGIRRLQAGHYLSLCDGRWEPRRYWEPRYSSTLRGSRSEIVGELRAAISQGVRRRLGNGDGETMGIMLSGGLDSSTVAAVAKHVAEPDRAPVAAYSATFPDHPSIDESALIDRLTTKLGLPSVRVVVRGGSVLAGSLEYLRAWELPPVSPNLFFWQPLLRRAAEDGLTGLLDGEAGDEVFGLSPYLVADRLRWGRALSAVRLVRRMPGARGAPRQAILRAVKEYGIKGALPHGFHEATRRARGPGHYVPSWFTSESADVFFETDDRWSWKVRRAPRWWAYLVDATGAGHGPVLGYDHVRRRATQAGLEARHPLSDVDLIELVLRIPPELLFDPRFSRPLLRESMKGLMPDEVRLRPEKSTFDALFHECLAGCDLPTVRRLLASNGAEVSAYVDPELMRRELLEAAPERHPGGLQTWALHVWRLITAECWLRSQGQDSFPDDLLATEDLRAPSYALVS